MWTSVEQCFRALEGQVDFCSLRLVEEVTENLSVRTGVAQPMTRRLDRGAMISVKHGGGLGYAATADLSPAGIEAAFSRARLWAEASAKVSVIDYRGIEPARPTGEFIGKGVEGPFDWRPKALLEFMLEEGGRANFDSRIVDWSMDLSRLDVRQRYLTSGGGRAEQAFRYIFPGFAVTAHGNGDTQTRSVGGQYRGVCRQGGLEILTDSGLTGSGRRTAEEALELLMAPNCPSGKMDLLLMPSQMMLQIHESIGHPLELDRILGDERNFAGTSFVTLEMFGRYQYGSPLLNVTFDPGHVDELATYGWDDDGDRAEKRYLIRNGLLERPLGGSVSIARTKAVGTMLDGVANSRACNWNRPPIDRMANINIEPGERSLAELIAGIEHGVLMDTNVSWSIDDSRNKFQFGCEWGRVIENGELKGVVKNPGYRGISATFWRSLKAVGDASTFDVLGTPYCGKGEPTQVIRVGHASPACVFDQVEVFGGEA